MCDVRQSCGRPWRSGTGRLVKADVHGRYSRLGAILSAVLLQLTSSIVSGAEANTASTNALPPKPIPGKLQALPSAFNHIGGLTLSDLRTEERHRTNLISHIAPAVVAVRVGRAMGSAVIISEDGLVLCAAHVCDRPGLDVVFNFADGKTAHGKTLGTNHQMDSGLMKITDPGPWPFAEVGDISSVRLGDWVLALGHPGGFDARRPIVVRLGRIILVGSDFLQTDCTLNSGDSGGPLFDMHGRVVGIHSRISTSTTANFHVPIATFLDTWDRLASGENWGDRTGNQANAGPYVGALGFSEENGYRLFRIEDGSPAAKAGLQAGDLIIRVDGQAIFGGESYVRTMQDMKPGKESVFRIQRGEQNLTIRVKVERTGGFGGGFNR